MNRSEYEKERLRSVHLSLLIIMTIAAIAMTGEAFLMSWELWVVPVMLLCTAFCWWVYVGGQFPEDTRLWMYAFTVWLIVIYHGIHATSFFDLVTLVAIELILFAQTNEKNLLRISVLVYFFCVAWHFFLMYVKHEYRVEWDVTHVARFLLHVLIVLFLYWMSSVIIKDRIGDRKADEREIAALREMQKRSEDFLSNVSHELRTPINAVYGIGSMMVKDAEEEEEQVRARNVFLAGRRLSGQIEDMLDYTEIDTGRLTVTEETYSIERVLDEVEETLGLAERSDIADVYVSVSPDVPAWLKGSPQFLKKILRHTLENAIRFTEEGRIDVLVSAKKRDYGVNLCLDVKDTGCGMTAQQMEQMRYAAYGSGMERVQDADGLGLGFSIINGLTASMNGFCTVSSKPGRGTHVHVCIPQQIGEEVKETTPAPRKEPESEAVQTAQVPYAKAKVRQPERISCDGKRALVVDDEEMNLIVAKAIFEEYGMDVHTAHSGQEAIGRVNAEAFDIIFMDHMMPEMDGVEAMHRIRTLLRDRAQKTVIVALTANAVSGARKMFLAEGFDAFVAKPIVRRELETVLKDTLAGG